MKPVNVGTSGLRVSPLCLGMMSYGNPPDTSSPSWREWHLDEAAAEGIVRRAADLGIAFFDTADMYAEGASEVVTGRVLRRVFSARDDYVVATKVFYPTAQGPNGAGLSRAHILSAVDASLRRLGVDHIDLYQVHRWDESTPVEETMQALDDLVRMGKVRYLGASSMYAWQFAKAQHAARTGGWTPFISMQNRYNLAYREEEREMIPLCLDQGVGLLPYSPLARGLLSGTRSRSGEPTASTRSASDPLMMQLHHEADHDVVDAVVEIAREREVSASQVALAWVLGGQGVTAPIVGATKVAHLEDAASAVSLVLTTQERERLEAPYVPHPVLGLS